MNTTPTNMDDVVDMRDITDRVESYAIIAHSRLAKRAMLDAIRDAYGIRTPTHAAKRGWSQPSDWEPGTQYVERRSAEHWHLCDEDGELLFCSRDHGSTSNG